MLAVDIFADCKQYAVMRKVLTPSEAIDIVGGTGAFARWWGADDATVSLWRSRGFPARTFVLMSERLRQEHQIDAPPSAWKMLEAAQ